MISAEKLPLEFAVVYFRVFLGVLQVGYIVVVLYSRHVIVCVGSKIQYCALLHIWALCQCMI